MEVTAYSIKLAFFILIKLMSNQHIWFDFAMAAAFWRIIFLWCWAQEAVLVSLLALVLLHLTSWQPSQAQLVGNRGVVSLPGETCTCEYSLQLIELKVQTLKREPVLEQTILSFPICIICWPTKVIQTPIWALWDNWLLIKTLLCIKVSELQQ